MHGDVSSSACVAGLRLYPMRLPYRLPNKRQSTNAALGLGFAGLLSCALVLTIVAPWGGQWWYGISLLSPVAGRYYLDRADRVEQVR